MDEATAFADPDNETRVQAAFSKLSQDKTVIMIAHRLSTVVGADRIYIIKDEQIVESGMNGIPYYIYLGDFEIEGLESSKIMADYHKTGLNLVYWVYPFKWALTFLPPSGMLTNLIKGGHAKITTADVITVYYFPEWK